MRGWPHNSIWLNKFYDRCARTVDKRVLLVVRNETRDSRSSHFRGSSRSVNPGLDPGSAITVSCVAHVRTSFSGFTGKLVTICMHMRD